jgi:hypothetical protein
MIQERGCGGGVRRAVCVHSVTYLRATNHTQRRTRNPQSQTHVDMRVVRGEGGEEEGGGGERVNHGRRGRPPHPPSLC